MGIEIAELVFPGTKKLVSEGCCPICRQKVTEFRDELSVREYKISGMCQKCQDSVFRE